MARKDTGLSAEIKLIRPMTTEELAIWGWLEPCKCIELTDGAILFPSRDEEGNGPGTLFGHDANGKDFSF